MNQQVLMMAIPGIIISLLSIACLWKIFVKAGKPGWFSIIPIFNFITLYQIAGAIIVLVAELVAAVVFSRICTIENDICLIGSFVCLFITIVTSFIFPIKLAKKFGKGIGFAILLIVFPIVGYPMLAFGKSQYIGKADKPREDTEEYDQEVPQDEENEIEPQDEIEDLDNETEEDLSEFTNENYVPEEDGNSDLTTEEENPEIEDLDDKEFIDPPVTIQDEEEPQIEDLDVIDMGDNEEETSEKDIDTIEQEEPDEDNEQQDDDSDLETKEIEF